MSGWSVSVGFCQSIKSLWKAQNWRDFSITGSIFINFYRCAVAHSASRMHAYRLVTGNALWREYRLGARLDLNRDLHALGDNTHICCEQAGQFPVVVHKWQRRTRSSVRSRKSGVGSKNERWISWANKNTWGSRLAIMQSLFRNK